MNQVEKMFEVASRKKIRFQHNGVISVEDLWDLSLTSLDKIYMELDAKIEKTQQKSLLATKSKDDKELETKIEIVKHIVGVKLAEATEREMAREKKEQKQRLLEILSEKENENLKSMSVEDIKLKLAELE